MDDVFLYCTTVPYVVGIGFLFLAENGGISVSRDFPAFEQAAP